MIKGNDRMLELFVKVIRVAVIFFWLAFVLSLASIVPGPAASIIIWLGAFVLVMHLAEYLYARHILTTMDRDKVSFVRTMLFGFTHLMPLLRER